ncbi:MAG: hypothetical protein IJM44_07275, partial [Ruminococcus sp.]|nr:hypothetical protein [Ruminococcus sp.]
GNIFDGCIAYNNSDDGWDLYAKTETGPTGVVTIKNCIAFRNGFTEDGRGYGNCDGNGFKLGGGGVGTRHVVENCLAFENLNCGFTDNNNPEFGVLKDCTAYNNGIGGNGKANYYVYRCSETADIQNILTYYNTSKVSKTNASGIKVANDKFKGTLKNSLYYNSKYYYNSGSTTCDGSSPKVGDVVTPSDSDFITLSVGAMGTDFHKNWRNSDGSPKPAGFAETNGTYKSLGYHMSGGVAQTATPDVYAGGTDPVQTTTSGGQTTTQQTTTTTAAGTQTPAAGAQVHDFTLNGTNSSFYTISGNLSTAKGTVNYDGKTLTQCLKIETATSITFNAASAGTLTLVFVEPAATIKVDGTKYTSSGDGIITVELSAGQHTVTKADTANLFYMVYSESGAAASTTSTAATTTTAAATSVTESATTTVTETAPVQSATTGDDAEASLYGDANDDGSVNMADAVFIMRVNADPDSFQFTANGKANADVYAHGDGVSNMDALAIQWLEAGLVEALPTEGI